jgi:hypothetical protein
MSRTAQSLLPPPQAVVLPAIRYAPERTRPAEEVRPAAERVQLVAVWMGIVTFCLAFWVAVTVLFVS